MTTTLKITGMSCAHCVKHVSGALSGIPGVTKVSVSLEDGAAEVEHTGDATPEAMAAAVAEAGYSCV